MRVGRISCEADPPEERERPQLAVLVFAFLADSHPAGAFGVDTFGPDREFGCPYRCIGERYG